MSRRQLAVRSGWAAAGALLLCFALVAAQSKKEDAPKAPDAPKAEAKEGEKPAPGEGEKAERPRPSRELAPGQVVRIVMDALKNNDDKNSGIAVAFDFASPDNRKVTGPLERFVPMVKNPAYAPMLNFKSAEYGTVAVRDDLAQAVVTVVAADGEKAAYVFRLSKQPDDAGEHPGCWLTDGVLRIQPGTEPAPPGDAPVGSDRA